MVESLEEYQLICNEEFAAQAAGPNAWREIMHYAGQYIEDGPIEIYQVTRKLVGKASKGDKIATYVSSHSHGGLPWDLTKG